MTQIMRCCSHHQQNKTMTLIDRPVRLDWRHTLFNKAKHWSNRDNTVHKCVYTPHITCLRG